MIETRIEKLVKRSAHQARKAKGEATAELKRGDGGASKRSTANKSGKKQSKMVLLSNPSRWLSKKKGNGVCQDEKGSSTRAV